MSEMVFSDAHPAVLATQVVKAMMYSWQCSVYAESGVEADIGCDSEVSKSSGPVITRMDVYRQDT